METGQSATVSMHQSQMTPLNETNQIRSLDDVMTRRLKNRERQRRYRARKRLEAERKRVQTSQLLQHHGADIRNTQHTPVAQPQDTHVVPQGKKEGTNPQSAQMPVNGTLQDFASRVYCQRDWKKDARRVHLHKDQAVSGNQIPRFSAQVNVDPPVVSGVQQGAPLLDNDGTRRAAPGRRHWKAEARNKKS